MKYQLYIGNMNGASPAGTSNNKEENYERVYC